MARNIDDILLNKQYQARLDVPMDEKRGDWEQRRRTYREGGRLDKLFDILSTGGYAVGGWAMTLREGYELPAGKSRAEYIMDKKNWSRNVGFAMSHGVEMSDVLELKGFWAGLAVNIATDPLSAMPAGTIRKLGGGIKSGMSKLTPAIVEKPLIAGSEVISKGVVTRASQLYQYTGRKMLGVRDILGETFEAGYQFKKLGGKSAEFYESYTEMVRTRRGAGAQAFHEVREMGRDYKNMGSMATRYIEEGISTGVGELDKYLDDVVKPYTDTLRATEKLAGIDVGKIANYVPHMITKEGQKIFDKFETGDEAMKFLSEKVSATYSKERLFEGTIHDINKAVGTKIFEEDLWAALSIRAKKSATDVRTAEWLGEVTKKFGMEPVGDVTTSTPTVAARAARETLHAYEGIEQSFRSYVNRVEGGGIYPIEFLTNAIEVGKRSVFKGKTEHMRSIVSGISERVEKHKYYTKQINDLEMEALQYKHSIIREEGRGIAADEHVLNSFRKSLTKVEEMGLPAQRKLLAIQKGELKASVLTIQREVLDPINREMNVFRSKADATKTVRTLGEPVTQSIDYMALRRKDISAQFPKQIGKFLDELDEIKPRDTVIAKADVAYGAAMGFWKKSVTVGIGALVHSAFFARNVSTGQLQNVQEIGIWRTIRANVANEMLARGVGTFATKEHGEVSADAMKRLMRESGMMESSGMADIKMAERLYPTATQRMMDLGGSLMTTTENMVRRPLWLDQIARKTEKETAKTISKVHFDYSQEALTVAERGIKKYAMPFYTWTRRNVERQVRGLISDPRKVERYGMIQRQSIKAAGLEEEYEARPEWQENAYMLPDPLHKGQLMNVPVPLVDLMIDPDSMYFGLSPIKSLIDIGSIRSGWGSEEYKSQKTKKVLEQLFFGRYRATARKLSDPSTLASEKAMYMAGMPTYEVVPEKVSFEDFEDYRHRTYTPSKEQEYAAWVLAGQPKGFKILTLGEKQSGMAFEEDRIIKPKWYEVWKKDTVIPGTRPEFDIMAISEELYERTRGYKFTDADLAKLTTLKGADQTQALEQIVGKWEDWKESRYTSEAADVEQKMQAWIKSGSPSDFINKVYHNENGELVGVAVFERNEMEEIQGYLAHHVQLSNAAFEWAFVQSDMPPEEFLMQEYRKENAKYVSMQAAREELRGFEVDAPVAAEGWGMAQAMEYTAYRKGRIDHEQDLIERAMQRGETQ